MDNKEPSAARIEDGVFLGFVLIVSVAFALVIEPFFAAILWGVIAAILFSPVNQGLVGMMPRPRNSAAALTLLLIVALVIVPAIILALAMVQAATLFYAQEIGSARVGKEWVSTG